MNKTILSALAAIGFSTVLAPAGLNAQSPIHANVPFAFSVDSKSFPAGEYRVMRNATGILTVQTGDGRSSIMTGALPPDRNRTPGSAKLGFHRYGDRYFLTSVSDNEREWRLHTSVAEREVMAKAVSPTPVEIVASNRR